jgi:putative phosphoribosyl transferase
VSPNGRGGMSDERPDPGARGAAPAGGRAESKPRKAPPVIPMNDADLSGTATQVRIPAGDALLVGELRTPPETTGIVLFAHGSGSGRRSPRNQAVARELEAAGLSTLLFDLLTEEEEREEEYTRHLRFDIGLLSRRLHDAVRWVDDEPTTRGLGIGLFGASTGAAAALSAAARSRGRVGAVVSRGGRPDLAGDALESVICPVLLIVGGRDEAVLSLNRQALARIAGPKRLEVVPGAGHLFEEPGSLERVSALAARWFARHLPVDVGSDVAEGAPSTGS